jgi:hypothetical protein
MDTKEIQKAKSLSQMVASLGKPRPQETVEKLVYTGMPGRKGEKGERGSTGMTGKDAIPETPSSIANKLNTLQGVLDAKVLKGLPEFDVKSLKIGGKNQLEMRDIKGARLDMGDQRWHGGGTNISVGTTAPANPSADTLWIDTN